MSEAIKAGGGQSPGDPPPTNPFGPEGLSFVGSVFVAVADRIAAGKSSHNDVTSFGLMLPYVAYFNGLDRIGGGQSPGDPPPTNPKG